MQKKKEFSKIWEKIEPYVLVLVIWTLLTTIFPIQKYIGNTIASVLTWVIQIGAFGLLGFQLSRNKEKVSSVKYGAYLGAILGLIYAIVGILSFYLFPQNYQEAINIAIQSGADAKLVNLFVKIGLYFNLVLMPVLTGAIGALITWLSSIIFKKK